MKTKHCRHINKYHEDTCGYCKVPKCIVYMVGVDNLPGFLWYCYTQSKKPYGGKCNDCKGRNDAYVVVNRVWRKAIGSSKIRFLCLSCLEARIGRHLTVEDFTHAPINYMSPNFDCREFIKHKTP